MRVLRSNSLAAMLSVGLCCLAAHSAVAADAEDRGGIQWFATLSPALQAAKQTGRPILFLTAAPHCGGVSGVW